MHEVCSSCRDIECLPRLESLSIARGLLKSLSVKQGLKYDSPQSAYEIQAFVDFHKLNVDEILDPLPSFGRSTTDPIEHSVTFSTLLETFNQFFYRFGPGPYIYPLLILTGFLQGN